MPTIFFVNQLDVRNLQQMMNNNDSPSDSYMEILRNWTITIVNVKFVTTEQSMWLIILHHQLLVIS